MKTTKQTRFIPLTVAVSLLLAPLAMAQPTNATADAQMSATTNNLASAPDTTATNEAVAIEFASVIGPLLHPTSRRTIAPMTELNDNKTPADQLREMRDLLAAIIREATNQGVVEIWDLASRADKLAAELLLRETDRR